MFFDFRYLQSHKPGEAETAIKHGKSAAKSAVRTTSTIYFAFVLLIVVVMFAFVIFAQFWIVGLDNQYNSQHQYNDYNSRRSRPSSHGHGYRTVGEF